MGAAVLLLSGLGAAPAAAADPKPITADLLSTWQTNGRVWALESVNGVVFAAGDFTAVRPPGAAPGVGEVARTNLAAFSAATGELLPCAPTFTIGTGSVTVRALEASPDGTRLYVGGTFSKINGTGLANLASLDVATCTLTPSAQFRRPGVNGRVYGLHAVDNALYAVGEFTKVDTLARPKFASFSTTGALSGLTATFSATTRAVLAAPDAGRVYVGGDFSTVNGTSARAIVALNLSDGSIAQTFPGWMPNTSVTKALVRSGNTFFLGAEGTGGGVFDGRLAADVATGALLWKDTCLGATQALAVKDGLLYSGHHAHDCSSTAGGFVDSGFRQHLLAQNISDKTIRHWFPDTNEGFEMGVTEALGPRALVFAGNDLWVGGEFTAVNDFSENAAPQWGLARFAGSPDTGTNHSPALSVSSTIRGKVNIRWTTAYDRDDESLTYELYRDGVLVNTQTSISKEWNRPVLSYTDSATPGATVSYRMRVLEVDGENTGPLGSATSVVVSSQDLPYAGQILSDGATHLWRLGDAAGSTSAADAAATGAGSAGIINGSLTFGQTGAIPSITDTAAQFGSGNIASPTILPGPTSYSVEAWFKTNTTRGGKLIGFGSSRNGTSSQYDRHVYMTNAGKLIFGAYTGTTHTVVSPLSYNDNAWHHVVATQGADGMKLYVDAVLVGTNTQTGAEPYNGYWRIGADNLNSWPSQPTSREFAGTMDEVAVYDGKVITATQVSGHFAEGRPGSDTQAPSQPTGLNASLAGSRVSLTWTAATDNTRVTGYRVYRGTSADFTANDASFIAETTDPSFVDGGAPEGRVYYRVDAGDAAGNRSPVSDSTPVNVPVGPKTVVASEDSYSHASAKTTNYGTSGSLAANGNPAITSVMRFAVPATPDGKKIDTATLTVRTTSLATAGSADAMAVRTADGGWDEATLTYNNRPAVGSSTLGTLAGGTALSTTYTIPLSTTGVQGLAGTNATLAMVGSGTDTLWFSSSEATGQKPTLTITYADADLPDTEEPSAPTGLQAQPQGTGVALSWTAATDNVGVASYNVHRGTTADFTVSGANRIGESTGVGFTDVSPVVGTAYYRVTAVDAVGNEGDASASDSAFVAAAPVTVVPSADTYSHGLQKTTNYGTSQSMSAMGNPVLNSFVRFQVPSVPAGHAIQAVTLRLQTTTLASAGSVSSFRVMVAGNNWDEATLTANLQPAISSDQLGVVPAGTAANTAYTITLDPALVRQYAGQDLTIAIVGDAAVTDSLWLVTRNAASGKPALTVTFGEAA